MAKKRPILMKAAELVFNPDLYPRHQTSADNKRRIREAIEAGAVMPPVVVDAKTKEIVDGVHRTEEALDRLGPEAEIAVEKRDYESEAEKFLDAMALNSSHGLVLSAYDRAKCTVMIRRYGIDITAAAVALNTTAKKLEAIFDRKTAVLEGHNVPIKDTLRHMARKEITREQLEGNRRAVGHSQLFLINQIVNLVEKNLIETDNEKVMAALEHLVDVLEHFRVAA